MLIEFLEEAVTLGCDALEIEYKDRKEWVFAFKGAVGCGIGNLDPDEAKPLFKEMNELRKKKRAILGGVSYRLVFSRYESFGEWVHRIEVKIDPKQSAGQPRSIRRT